MSRLFRYLTGFASSDAGASEPPGLVYNEDGTVDVIAPDGTRTQLPGGSSQLITPPDIDDLEIWLDASDATTINTGSPSDDDPVSAWADKSGNGFDFAQATSDAQPIYKTAVQNGKSVVRFSSNGAADPEWMDAADAVSFLNDKPGVTIIAAVNVAAGGGAVFMALTNSEASRRACAVYSVTTGSLTDLDIGASNDDSSDAADVMYSSIGVGSFGTIHLLASAGAADVETGQAVSDCSAPTMLSEASGAGTIISITPGNFPDTDCDAVRIGGTNNEPGPAILDGDLLELAVYSRALNAIERRQLMEYLSSKWATL